MFPLLSLVYIFRLLYSDCALRTCVFRPFAFHRLLRRPYLDNRLSNCTIYNLSIYYTRTNGMAFTKSGIQDAGAHDVYKSIRHTKAGQRGQLQIHSFTGAESPSSGWSKTADSQCCSILRRLSRKDGRYFASGCFGGNFGSCVCNESGRKFWSLRRNSTKELNLL